MNSYDLEGRIALVTGARRGIGRAIALRLAASGAVTVVSDLNMEGCEKVAAEIREAGGAGLALRLDVSSEEDIRSAVAEIEGKYRRLDILVNNAGIYIQQEVELMATEEIDRVIGVNLRGAILCAKYSLPGMKRNRYGKIVNIASIAGFVGFPSSALHSATKGALVAVTRDLALNYAKYGINVNAIAPGIIETPMTAELLQDRAEKKAILRNIPYGRIGSTADIANGVAFLVSDDSDYITGQTLVIDGGWISV
ncbi:MAG TPA: glucose 1-dehydrogenase [Geobacteraceae bacterium]|nr:glucose 1-dehydrogenase [Geobacteraceae bacterium]